MDAKPLPLSRLYGRRKGRPLHKRKSRLMKELLAHFQITLPGRDQLDLRQLRCAVAIQFQATLAVQPGLQLKLHSIG